MKLKKLEIEGFRRIKKSSIDLADATFLIGENNVGKSTIFKALEKLLTVSAKCDEQDFYCSKEGTKTEKIVLTAEFSDLPPESQNWKGFKGRVLIYEQGREKSYNIK